MSVGARERHGRVWLLRLRFHGVGVVVLGLLLLAWCVLGSARASISEDPPPVSIGSAHAPTKDAAADLSHDEELDDDQDPDRMQAFRARAMTFLQHWVAERGLDHSLHLLRDRILVAEDLVLREHRVFQEVPVYDPLSGGVEMQPKVVTVLGQRMERTARQMEMQLRLQGAGYARAAVSEDLEGHLAVTAWLPWSPPASQSILTKPSQTSPDAYEPRVRVKVLSANIWNYNEWEARLPVLAAAMRKLGSDVIGFQEVRAIRSANKLMTLARSQVSDLAKELPELSHFVYQPAMGFMEGHDAYVHEGVAIFSRYPLTHCSHLELSKDHWDRLDFHQRVCLRCLVHVDSEHRFWFMTTHLSLSSRARNRTLPEIARWSSAGGAYGPESAFSDLYVNDWASPGSEGNPENPGPSEWARLEQNEAVAIPAVLVGDMNAQLNHLKNPLADAGFRDAWLEAGKAAEGDASWTFSSWEPQSRIDYVFLRGQGVQAVDAQLVGASVPEGADPTDRSKYPSDHLLLQAELELRPASPPEQADSHEHKQIAAADPPVHTDL